MNNKIFQKAKNLVFALALALGLLLPASATLALPQKAGPVARVLSTPNDTYYGSQWNLSSGDYRIDAPAAWAIWGANTPGLADTIVAVIDTGITDHEDLTGRVLDGYDFITDATAANDGDGRDADAHDEGDYCGVTNSSWRGTSVAGIIGANSNNTVGVAGIDWNAKILPVRVSGRCSATRQDIVDGMLWAAGIDVGALHNSKPAKVLNLSAGWGGVCTQADQAVINSITAQGAVVVVAAGDNNGAPGSPANCNDVVTVAATDLNGNRASYSNNGSTVKISAPGGSTGNLVLTTSNSGDQTPNAGVGSSTYPGKASTSIAAAHVSGVVSLMFAANPYMIPSQVLQILQETVKPFAGSGSPLCTTSICGWGILDAGEAVRVANMPDLIITGVTLLNHATQLPDPSPYDQAFDVSITIKNQGGLNLPGMDPISVIDRRVYIDIDPTTPSLIDDPTTGHLDDLVGTLGSNRFERTENNHIIAPGDSDTLSVEIPAGVPNLNGEHQIYAYADADGNVTESFEANNHFAPVTKNPFIQGALTYPHQGQNIDTDYNPTYKWNEVIEATYYHLYLASPGGVILDQWYLASVVCGVDNGASTNTCAVTPGPSATLGNGTYSWYMQSYNPSTGYSPWSNGAQPTNFTTMIPSVPSAATSLSPGTVNPATPTDIGTNYNPTLSWDKIAAATYYRLYVSGPGGVVLDQWYPSASICPTATCSVASPTLGGGTYAWYVQTYSPAGYGPWSNIVGGVIQPMRFSTATTPPAAATSLSPGTVNPATPADIGTTYTPTYSWDKITAASYYHLYISGPGGVILDQWYPSASICPTATCSVASPTLGGGIYSWYVQTYGPAGYGPWSNIVGGVIQPMRFSTSSTPPAAATSLSPGTVNPATPADIGTTYNPIYDWDKIPAATYYRLYVSGPGGVVLDQWYQASVICDTPTPNKCSVPSPTLSGGIYSWYVQTYGPTGYGAWSNTISGVIQPMRFSMTITPPAAATSLSPGTVNPATPADIGTTYTPTYDWDKMPAASYYHLYVNGPGGVVLDQWYQASIICDTPTPDKCSVPSPTLGGGIYSWYVQTYGPAGYGPWSNTISGVIQPMRFSTSTTPPTAVDLTDPLTNPREGDNVGTEYNPTYTWPKVGAATYYQIYVAGPSGLVLNQWYLASSICNDTNNTCTVGLDVPTPTLMVGGIYVWYVQTYGPAGYGPWSNIVGGVPQPTHFHVDAPTIPKAATNLLANGTPTSHTPTYTWDKVPMAIWYRLYVKGPSGVVKDQWYQAASTCPGGICSVVSPTLASGDYIWWVQTYSAAGYGPWKKATFTVSP